MNNRQLIEILDRLAPPSLAEHWDNTGLSVGKLDNEISKIMVALEPSEKVINQAVEQKVDVLITHHPMIFKPISGISYDSLVGRKIIDLVQNDILTFSMHTNMDIAIMASYAAQMFRLKDAKRLEITCTMMEDDEEVPCGFGSIGYVDDIKFIDYIDTIKKQLNIECVRTVGDVDTIIRKVAVLPGSGKSFIGKCIKDSVDVLITGDIDYHSASDARDMGLCIIDAGHFETEYFFTDFMISFLEDELSKLGEDSIEIIKAVENPPLVYR